QGLRGENNYLKFEDKPAYDDVEEIADRYLRDFIAGTIDQVEVAYMKFLNASVQKPVVETLLPLARSAPQDAAKHATGAKAEAPRGEGGRGAVGRKVEYEFVPDANDILQELLPVSFKVRLFKCFLDAAVSEQIARRVTMKQATENATDMIKSISLQYNRA